MRPSIALVATLAIIGSWQVFDQVFIITQGTREDHPDTGLPQLQEELRRRPVRPGRGDRLRAVPDHHRPGRPATVAQPRRGSRRDRGGPEAPPGPLLLAGYLVLVLGLMLYLGPFVIQVANSFKTDPDAIANPVSLVPDPFSTAAWETPSSATRRSTPRCRGGWPTASS